MPNKNSQSNKKGKQSHQDQCPNQYFGKTKYSKLGKELTNVIQ